MCSAVNIKQPQPHVGMFVYVCTVSVCIAGNIKCCALCLCPMYSAVNRKWTGPLCYTLGVCVCTVLLTSNGQGHCVTHVDVFVYSDVNLSYITHTPSPISLLFCACVVCIVSLISSFLFVSGQIQFIFCSWLELMLIFTWVCTQQATQM